MMVVRHLEGGSISFSRRASDEQLENEGALSRAGMPPFQKSAVFLNIVQTGVGGGQPMFKNYVGNCRVFWRSFNNMTFA